MKIINYRPDVELELPLLEMASSEDQWQAFKARKLLELVRYLQAKGPIPCAAGHFMLQELWLRPYRSGDRTLVKVWVDWQDYPQMKEGLPESHYRFQISHEDARTSSDARATTLEDAERVICEAFRWR